jgi:hypothetical protein
MSTRGRTIVILLIGVLLVTIGMPQQLSSVALASYSSQGNAPTGRTIAYPGRLNDAAGQPVTNGVYAFTFDLYDTETGGRVQWSETQEGVIVRAGMFNTSLGSVSSIPAALLDGRDLWLSVSVRGPGEAGFTALTPRQQVNATTDPQAVNNGACVHDHVGDVWNASVNWSNGALRINNNGSGPAFWGWNTGGGNGVRGDGWGTGIGVYGEGENGPGVAGRSANGYGVEGSGDSMSGGGVYAHSVDGYGLFAHSDTNSSIYVDGAGFAGVYVESAGWVGVGVWSATNSGMYVHSAGGDGVLVDSASWDGVHVVTAGGAYYGSGKKGAEDFLVLNTGEVRSQVGFATPANDFAVMMRVDGTKSDYEPGDVLVISGDQGQAAGLCAASYSPTVIGVYSAAPGFLGGQTVTGKAEDSNSIPVAIMGIVSVKVSAENGAIQPGDLLVTSSTPGYAMRGEDPAVGTILGKALGTLDSGTGTILVLLMLR